MATKGMAITATNYNGEIQNGDEKWLDCARLSRSYFVHTIHKYNTYSNY